MKNLLILFLTILNCNLINSQVISSKIFIQDECYYVVKTEQGNGILIENHLDSFVNSQPKRPLFIDIKAIDPFNKSMINFDFKDSCVYSIASFYSFKGTVSIETYKSYFYKIPFAKMKDVNEENFKIKKEEGQLPIRKYEFTLAMSHEPLSKNPFFRSPAKLNLNMFYDLIYVSNSQLSFFTYNQGTDELEYWNFFGKIQMARDRKLGDNEDAKWELTHSYTLNKKLTNNFVTVSAKDNVYFITHEGIIYLANEKLKEVGKLPDNLENGFVIIDNDKQELSYILKSDFNKGNTTMRKLLQNVIKIGL